MPEAVIVSTARSPIGRAFKGSLTEMRGDDLTVQMVKAALAKVPELDPKDITDLMLGCGLPGGEQGFNMGRVVAVLAGYDHLPGTTITRYCSSSLQTTRMAFHAIKAGEGDAFISAGVETVSRFSKGNSDHIEGQDLKNPVFEDAMQRTDKLAQGGQEWHDPREEDSIPDVYIAMGQTAENVQQLIGMSRRGAGRVRRPQPEPRREGHRRRLLGQGHHPRHPARRLDGVGRRRAARRRDARGRLPAQAGVP